jgi:membrane peptidoglycan carboxypeptidase
MSSNFLPPQDNQQPPKRRTGLLSGGYAGQQPPSQQAPSLSPGAGTAPSAFQRPPTGNLPGQFGPPSQLPSPQQRWNGPAFMARPLQVVQRWSSKMAALRHSAPAVDPNPLVRYRPHQPPALSGGYPERPVPTRSEPWRRSRTQKITRMMRNRRERWYKNRPSKRFGTIVLSVIAALLVILIASGGISSYAYYQSQLPKLQGLANYQGTQSTRIYDRNGNLLYTLSGQYGHSIPVSYSEIPGVMQDAQIATEDKTFWTNDGIDPQAILRSAFVDTSSQTAATGASTITQQVIKNLDHQTQQNLQRKINEAALAIGLTQEYPKWKILEMYFNVAPYGDQEQGIEAAAQDFFGLQPMCSANFNCVPAVAFLDRDLTRCKVSKPKIDETTCAVDPLLALARASLLAGIPQNPPDYDPLANSDHTLLFERQDYVLKQMMADGMSINLGLGSHTQDAGPITPAVIQQVEALSKKITYVGFQNTDSAPHFVQWIINTLATALGNGDYTTGLETLETSGLNIRTTLDSNLQTYVENAVKRHITEPEYQMFQGVTVTLSTDYQIHDSAVVVMDVKTGEVLAMDGSVNWNDTSRAGGGEINMAISPRQPGSSFKPIVMAAAYEMGYYPGIVQGDFKTYFPQGSSSLSSAFVPTDYGDTYHNEYTNIENAISNSLNIPAIKMGYYAGLKNVYNMATRLGITSIVPEQGVTNGLVPSMPIGVDPVSLLQMVDAYQAFANQGVRIPPQGILNIWDNYGHELYQYNPATAGIRVLSPQIAYLVTETLNSSPENIIDRETEFENDHALDMTDWTLPDGTHPDVAAKTGTTGTGTINDNWTLGYTPNLVVGVWSGNADDSPMLHSIGVTGAAPIWHSVMEYASGHCETYLDDVPCPPRDLPTYTEVHFPVPSGIVQQEVNTVNGLAGTGYLSYMINGEQPQQSGLITCTNTGNTGNGNGSGGNGGTGNPTTSACTGSTTPPSQRRRRGG